LDKGLVLSPTNKLKIDCYVDADFAGLWPHENKNNPSCMKSRKDFFIKLSGCPVIWGSKLQGSIALSTMEAKYLALSSTMRKLIPFQELVLAIGTVVGFSDNEIATFCTTVWDQLGCRVQGHWQIWIQVVARQGLSILLLKHTGFVTN
jgi:hypothetical protein